MKEFDFIIVGTGMGGSAAGYQLARGGASVLFLEKGVDLTHQNFGMRGEYAEVHSKGKSDASILKACGRNTEMAIDKNGGREFNPFIGCGTGGSTAIYGMALERFFPADFTPSKNFSEEELINSSLPANWPITYSELSPYYDEIESLFGLAGTHDPLRTDKAKLSNTNPLSKTNEFFSDFFESRNLHPYQLPTACHFDKLQKESQGFLDNDGAKKDGNTVFLQPALEKHNAKLMTETQVINISAKGHVVKEVVCKSGNNLFTLKAKHIILAAGAIQTTKLLLSSCNPEHPQGLANSTGLIGKNLMRHYIDLYAIKPETLYPNEIVRKQIAFNDFYQQDGKKLGTFQSFGFLPPEDVLLHDLENDLKKYSKLATTLFKSVKSIVKNEIRKLSQKSVIFASILEDLPYESNHLQVCPHTGKIIINYKVSANELKRIQCFRNKISNTLQPLKFQVIKQAKSNQRIAHICGTCRFGDDPTNSVLNKNNLCHDLDNLTVLDSSFFPSSGGTNPSLTIAANAIRVSNHLLSKPLTKRYVYEKSSM